MRKKKKSLSVWTRDRQLVFKKMNEIESYS